MAAVVFFAAVGFFAAVFFAAGFLAGVFLFVTLCPGSYGARIVTGSACARGRTTAHAIVCGNRLGDAYASPSSIILSKKRRSW